MLPLRDNIPSRTFPFVNIALILANILVFVHQVKLGPEEAELIARYGLTPRYLVSLANLQHHGLVLWLAPLFTCMFLHGNVLHIGGNMLFLWIFGDNVEDRIGHFRFLLFYLLCGVLASLLHVFTHVRSDIPTVGASGAIAGVLGAYMVMFRHSRVLTLVPLLFILTTVEIPAVLFLGLWFVFQFLQGLTEPLQGAGGVATWAHIGGFVAGVYITKRWFARRRWMDADSGRPYV